MVVREQSRRLGNGGGEAANASRVSQTGFKGVIRHKLPFDVLIGDFGHSFDEVGVEGTSRIEWDELSVVIVPYERPESVIVETEFRSISDSTAAIAVRWAELR